MRITARPAGTWVAGLTACLALLGSATGGLAAAASTAPRAPSTMAGRPSVPAPGASSELFGVACPTAASCWAVGDYVRNGTTLNQALHWNGRTWSGVPTPQPAGTTGAGRGFLDGVACPVPASCWAVGVYYKPGGSGLNQALHWNGRRWSLVPTPDPRGSGHDGSALFGVRCTGPGDCWAVGSYQRGTGVAGPVLTEALHWDGRAWSLVPTPSPGGTASHDRSELADVRCTSPGNCWAVGDYGTTGSGTSLGTGLTLVLHWNGRRWSRVPTPNPAGTGEGARNTLVGVACTSAASCWAVGSYGTIGTAGHPGSLLNQALRWNGRRWSQVAAFNPDGNGGHNELISVTCTGPASCWAVGDFGGIGGGGVVVNQALHWNGRMWSLTSTPDPAGLASGDENFLDSVRCATATSCWAVGFGSPSSQADRNQALHWNGSTWSAG